MSKQQEREDAKKGCAGGVSAGWQKLLSINGHRLVLKKARLRKNFDQPPSHSGVGGSKRRRSSRGGGRGRGRSSGSGRSRGRGVGRGGGGSGWWWWWW